MSQVSVDKHKCKSRQHFGSISRFTKPKKEENAQGDQRTKWVSFHIQINKIYCSCSYRCIFSHTFGEGKVLVLVSNITEKKKMKHIRPQPFSPPPWPPPPPVLLLPLLQDFPPPLLLPLLLAVPPPPLLVPWRRRRHALFWQVIPHTQPL